MDFRALSRRVGIAAAVATVIALVAPYAFVTGYATELAGYYASGAVGWGGIALFALLSAVVIASVEQGNVDPGTLAGVAVVLGFATTASAATWALAVEPTAVFAEYRWLVWHARVVVALTVPVPLAAAAYARDLLS
jgi:hypothetical protein